MNKEAVLPLQIPNIEPTYGSVWGETQRDADWERVSPLLDLLSKLAEAAKRPIDDAYRGKVAGEEYAYDHRPYHALGVLIVRAEEALSSLGVDIE